MGGDYAPAEAVKGVQLFMEQVTDPSVSVPIAYRTIPAATAAPLPLELPQVLRSSA